MITANVTPEERQPFSGVRRLSAADLFQVSTRVIEVLSRLVSERGVPYHLRSGNDPEFVSKALLRWVANQGSSLP